MAAIDIVATYAQPPARAQRLVDIGFTIAFALQGAIWARELILALIARRVGDGTTESALGNANAIIRVLVSVALFALAIVVILDNLGRQRHRAGRRPRHRRHRHRPCRAGHLLRPVRGARHPVRQAVPARRHRPLRNDHGNGREDRPQDHAPARRRRRAGHHGQHQAARAGGSQRHRRARAANLAAVRPDLPDSPETIERLPEIVAEAVESVKNCKLVRCCADRIRTELDRLRTRLRRPQRAIRTRWRGTSRRSSSASSERSSARASNSPIRRRRPSPPRPTARW